jgi:hypothetical protein
VSRSRAGTSNQDNASPSPVWLDDADRVITARLLLTQDGPKVHWSHYDPWNYASVRKNWKPWVDALMPMGTSRMLYTSRGSDSCLPQRQVRVY